MENSNNLTPFEGEKIRKLWQDEQWYFSVVDVIGILTDSKDARNYWKVLKNRETQLVTICNQLKLTASDGRQRLTDCATTEGIFRIIMSVPSPKAEPLKMWLAEQGFSDNHEAAQIGGRIGGKALGNYEEESGLKVVSSENFLGLKGGESVKELPIDDPS